MRVRIPSQVAEGNRPSMLEDVMGVFIEIRAAEGGDDAKLLVQKQLKIYGRVAARRGL